MPHRNKPAPRPLPLFLELLRSETAARSGADAGARSTGSAAIRRPSARRPPAPMPVAGADRRRGAARLWRRRRRRSLFVPSLINPPNMLDLDDDARCCAGWRPAAAACCCSTGAGRARTAPSCRSPTMSSRLLLPLLGELGEPVDLVGYCLGGTMAIAAAQPGHGRARRDHRRAVAFRGFPDDVARRARRSVERMRRPPPTRSACCRWRCCKRPSGASTRSAPSPSSRPSRRSIRTAPRRGRSSCSRTGPMTAAACRRRRRARADRGHVRRRSAGQRTLDGRRRDRRSATRSTCPRSTSSPPPTASSPPRPRPAPASGSTLALGPCRHDRRRARRARRSGSRSPRWLSQLQQAARRAAPTPIAGDSIHDRRRHHRRQAHPRRQLPRRLRHHPRARARPRRDRGRARRRPGSRPTTSPK